MSLLVFPAELVRAAKLSYPTAPAPAPAPSAEEWWPCGRVLPIPYWHRLPVCTRVPGLLGPELFMIGI